MADPVTLAMMGAAAGAVTNKKDPLKGALLGATLGGVGGAMAPGLLGAGAPAAGFAGITPMGAQAAGGLIGMAPVSAPGVGAALSAGTQAAAPSMMSRLATPQALMAGASLAGSMSPQQQAVAPAPLRPGQPSQVVMQDIPQITMSRVNPQLIPNEAPPMGLFDVPPMIRSRLGPMQDELLEYFPSRRMMR